jgi:hypothetical protein
MVLFSIPNGGKRSAITAKIMKAEGQMSGVADLFLMYPHHGYHGLWIELKTDKGRQNENQKIFQTKAEQFGYKYCIVKSFEEFITTITEYLK